ANRGEQKGNPKVTVREAMETAAADLNSGKNKYEPEVEAAVRAVIGKVYMGLGLGLAAEEQISLAYSLGKQAYGEASPQTLQLARDLANANTFIGDAAAAEKVLDEAQKSAAQILGAKDPMAMLLASERGEAASHHAASYDERQRAEDKVLL